MTVTVTTPAVVGITAVGRVAVNGHVTDDAGRCHRCSDTHPLLPDSIRPALRLTRPQERLLAEVTATGTRRYNGRARRTIVALRDAGLVSATLDYEPRTGGGAQYVETWTVTREPAGDLDRGDRSVADGVTWTVVDVIRKSGGER